MPGWIARLGCLLLCLVAFVSPSCAQTGCSAGACASAGPRLVEVNTAQGALLNSLFQALLPGTSAKVSVLDWNALAHSNVNLNALIAQLGINLGLSDTAQVLGADISLAQLRVAMVQIAQADGNTAAVSALNALNPVLGATAGTIRLGDLLRISLPQGALADVSLNALDLLTGGVQLYNYRNVLTTPQPIAIDTAALGLPGLASVQIYVQVVEPPVYTCGGPGTAFHSAALRLKVNAAAVNNLDLAPLLSALNALGLVNITANASVLNLQVYADVARAEGTLTAVDGLAGAVSFSGRPGLVNLYVGTVTDGAFFNRTHVLTASDVTPIALTSVTVTANVSLLGIGLVALNIPLSVNARAVASGSPAMQSFTLSGTFPQTRTVSAGTVSVGTLVTSLLSNLTLAIEAGNVTASVLGIPLPILGAVLKVVTDVVSGATNVLLPQIAGLLSPLLNMVLGGLVDNLLSLLGIQIGKAVFTIEGIARQCAAVLSLEKILSPDDDAGRFDLTISQNGTSVITASAVGNGGKTSPIVTIPQASYDLAESAATGTSLSGYAASWTCTDQDGAAVANGEGNNFSYTAPAASNKPTLVTCRLLNRKRQSDLSITKSDNLSTYTPGMTGRYTITVSNAGPDSANGAMVHDAFPAGLRLAGPWRCASTGDGTCAAASGGAAGDASLAVTVSLPAQASAVIDVPVELDADSSSY